MKIPRTFIPEKDLEKKTHELIQDQKTIPPEDLTDEYKVLSTEEIVLNSKTIAQKLGILYADKNWKHCYIFKNKESKLIIEYNLAAGQYHDLHSLIIKCKKGWLKKETVFKSLGYEDPKERICTYTPGEWEQSLNQFYMLAQQK